MKLGSLDLSPKLIDLDHPVAILDEHLLKDERGNEVCYLSDKYLNRIAENNNRRIEETGDMAPVVIGHTEDRWPETRQPPLVGYAHDFFVSGGRREGNSVVPTKEKKAKKYLFTRMKVFENRMEDLYKFPRRSVELWTSRWEVDPISLLGATTPDRDLGLIKFARDGSSVVIPFSTEEENEMPEGFEDREYESNSPLTLSQLEQTEEWQFLRQLKEELEAESQMAPEAEGEMPMEGEEEMPVEGEEEVPAEEGEEVPVESEEEPGLPEEGEEEEEPIRHSAGYPGSTSTFVPSLQEPAKMARTKDNSDRIRLARLEKQLEQANANQTELLIRLRRAERGSDLLALEAEGIQLDIENELEFVTSMDDTQYQAHLDRIQKSYKRNQPSALPFNPAQAGRTGGRSAEERQSLVKKAMKESNGDPTKYDAIINAGNGEQVQ